MDKFAIAEKEIMSILTERVNAFTEKMSCAAGSTGVNEVFSDSWDLELNRYRKIASATD